MSSRAVSLWLRLTPPRPHRRTAGSFAAGSVSRAGAPYRGELAPRTIDLGRPRGRPLPKAEVLKNWGEDGEVEGYPPAEPAPLK